MSLIPDERLSEYFIEHGQQTFHHRNRVLSVPDPKIRFVDGRRPKGDRPAKQFEQRVLPLDGYRCRYCGIRVVPYEVFGETERILGREHFRMTDPEGRKPKNEQQHGAALAFCAVVDHILPWNLGGDSCLTNLVTACFSCNYGKGDFTLEQLGLDDPLSRPPILDDWRGMTEHLGALQTLT